MASARMNFSRSSKLGEKIQAAIQQGVEARKSLQELGRIVEKYIDDNAGIAADSGMNPNDVALFRNLLAYAGGELGGTVVQGSGIAVNTQTGVRQLLDALG